jgi:hypothetical protein
MRYRPIRGGGANILRNGINGGLRVLELAAETREVALGYGACTTSTSMRTSSRPKVGGTTRAARRTVATGGVARYGGGVIRRISRRRKTRYGEYE